MSVIMHLLKLKRLFLIFFAGIGIFSTVIFLLEIFGLSFGIAGCTNSMHPNIKCGSLYLSKSYNSPISLLASFQNYSNSSPYEVAENTFRSDLKNGDIISYAVCDSKGKVRNAFHRIIDDNCEVKYAKMTLRGVVTKGDAIDEIDGCIPHYSINYKMIWHS